MKIELIMKNFKLVCLLFILVSWKGENEKRYFVELISGPEEGTHFIKLVEEGLVCINYDLIDDKKNNHLLRVSWDDIQAKEYTNLQSFIQRQNAFTDFKEVYRESNFGIGYGFPKVYVIREPRYYKYKIITDYDKNNEKLDSLTYYMNALIPEKYKKLYSMPLVSTTGWNQEEIDFTYEFNKDESNPNIVKVTAKIINNSEDNIYFLSESCNGLDYYLTTSSDSAEILIMAHCNATFPRKIELKANSTYEFSTTIQLNSNVHRLGLNLKLIRLAKSVEVEGKFIDEIRKENKQRTMNFEGPIIKVE